MLQQFIIHYGEGDIKGMSKRNLRLDNYGISSKRYKELCGFCEQYPEWKKTLLHENTLQGVQYDDMPKNPNMGTSDMTGNAATKCADDYHKCLLIENVAKETNESIWEFMIKAVCYEVPVNYLIACENMPMSKSQFYEYRRRFFYNLDKKKN